MNNSFINVILIQVANTLIMEKKLNLLLLTSGHSASSSSIDDIVMIYVV